MSFIPAGELDSGVGYEEVKVPAKLCSVVEATPVGHRECSPNVWRKREGGGGEGERK